MFKHKLALALGVFVRDIEERMSLPELLDWITYYRHDPFGLERGDLQAGITASAVHNVNRTKRSDRIFAPPDFLLTFNKKESRKTGDEIEAALMAFALQNGATIKPKE